MFPLSSISESSACEITKTKRVREEDQRATYVVQENLKTLPPKRLKTEETTFSHRVSCLFGSSDKAPFWKKAFVEKFGQDLYAHFLRVDPGSEYYWMELCQIKRFVVLGECVIPLKNDSIEDSLKEGSFYFTDCFDRFAEQTKTVFSVQFPAEWGNCNEAAADVIYAHLEKVSLNPRTFDESFLYCCIAQYFGFEQLENQCLNYCLDYLDWLNCDITISLIIDPNSEQITKIFDFLWRERGTLYALQLLPDSLKPPFEILKFIEKFKALNMREELISNDEFPNLLFYLSVCPNLKRLSISHGEIVASTLDPLDTHCPRLEKLTFLGGRLSVEVLGDICHPELRLIDIGWLPIINMEEEKIELTDPDWEPKEIFPDPENCPKLEKVYGRGGGESFAAVYEQDGTINLIHE